MDGILEYLKKEYPDYHYRDIIESGEPMTLNELSKEWVQKQLLIHGAVEQNEQLFCNFDNVTDRSLTLGTEYKKIYEYNGLVLIINDLNQLGLYDKKTFFRSK